MARKRPGPDQLANGWDALRAGQWTSARAVFEAAVARGPSAEACEGLSWAAWWLDDADTVFAAREHAFQLYRKGGDPRSAARMATWLAADQLDFHGGVAVATGWLRRAQRLLHALPASAAHGWLAFQQGYIANLRGDTRRAEQLAIRACELGRTLEVPDLEMLGLALQGATLVARARVAEGMECLDEATAIALDGDATVPISGAWACCFLLSACTQVLDYERAFDWCQRIAEFADRYGSRYMLGYCRAEHAMIHLWRGRWSEAEATLAASIEDLARSRNALVGVPLVTLAELRRRQGRTADSQRLVDRAGASRAAQLCRARLALDRDDPRTAIELTERLLRQVPAHRKLDRAPALELLVRARLATGDRDAAAAAFAELREIARATGTPAYRASIDRAAGLLAAARGEHAEAQALFEDAVDRFDGLGASYDAAITRLDLVAALAARGRHDAAVRELEAASAQLGELGAATEARRARALRQTLSSRSRGGLPGISRRERDVLALLAGGHTNQRIAARLGLSEHTVHRHVANILRKLEVPTRAAAAARAVRAGLVEPAGG